MPLSLLVTFKYGQPDVVVVVVVVEVVVVGVKIIPHIEEFLWLCKNVTSPS